MLLCQPAASSSVPRLPAASQSSLLGDLPERVRAPADSVLRQRSGDADVVEERQEWVQVTSRLRTWLWSAVSNERKRPYPDARSDFLLSATGRPHAWLEEELL